MALANRRTPVIVPAMDPAPAPVRDDDLEERLARIERAQAHQPPALNRLLRYLPVLALANVFIAAPAMLLSGVLAYFTFVQAEATEKMQVASVWPRVTYNNFNQQNENGGKIAISLSNKGVGPAIIEGLQVRYRDHAFGNPRALLDACCGAKGEKLAIGHGSVRGEVLRPGEEAMVTQLAARGSPAEVYRRFNSERLRLEISTCYCSVFGDCWVDDGVASKPRPVAQCPADWVQFDAVLRAGRVRS